ncbi:MAG: hypothetical protein LKI59_04835 [Bacteroidales bacterium]|jgi:hypothetical protein|nr:hypothetical protein [Bacteroidales bacterium]
MCFADEIRKLLINSSEAFSEEKAGDMVIFGSGKANIIAVPIKAKSPDEAEEQHGILSEIIEKMEKRPIVIAEDTWYRQKRQLEARIRAHIGIFGHIQARNCEIRKIDKTVSSGFMNACHGYGDASCRYRYGLFVKHCRGNCPDGITEGMMVASAGFSNARRWIKGNKTVRSYEWIRYASLPDIRVAGGMGKILKSFTREVGPDDVMSYADLEWSDGSAYKLLGFKPESFRSPVLFMIDPGTWSRTPVGRIGGTGKSHIENSCCLYYKNLGSLKYRLDTTGF